VSFFVDDDSDILEDAEEAGRFHARRNHPLDECAPQGGGEYDVRWYRGWEAEKARLRKFS
jgi:hypothetical protein